MAMKFALITLLCFGAALARIEEHDWLNSVSPNRRIDDSAFRPGREYHFFYNGQLTTGIAGSSKQHSANRIQALVTVAIKSETNCILKLEQIRFGKMNRQIPNPRKIMPFDAFEETPLEQHLKQKLETTVKFSYTNGMVRDIEFDSREEPWSANVKRGVLNLLQVNLQQHRRIETPEESLLTNMARRNGNEEDGQPIFYRVMEETLEGECETLYTLQRQPERRSSNSPVLNVTKSINFEKCNKRPQIKYNFRFSAKCPTCDPKYEDEEKFLKTSTVMQYNITGDKNSFLIDSARVESQYVFTPFDEEANVIVTYVNQTLVLVKTSPIRSNLQEPQNRIKSDSNMLFTLDWDIALEKFSMHGQSESTRRLLHENGRSNSEVNKVEMIKKIIQRMVTQMKEQVDEELPRLFSHLINWVRQCDERELEQIVKMQEPGQLSPEEEKKIKNIIPQTLGACGTKECVKILVQKIKQGHVHPLRAVGALKGLLNTRVVSKDMITEIMQLAESEKAREFEPLKRASWLITGSLINALCAENEDQLALEMKEDAKKLCPRDLKDQYVKVLFEKLHRATTWQEKVLMLKTIGNAGLDLSIFELEKIIRQQESSHPMYVRLEAILALRELKDDMPKKIQRVLMPVILNRREYPTIRSIATYMIFQTQPERPILDQLARSLINEPSHQFAAFLYTKLDTYANSTNPCEQQLATDSKLALRQAKRVSTGLGYSRFLHMSFHAPEQKVGLDLDFGAIYSNVSYIPRHIGAALHMNGLGYWQKYLTTISLFNEGLEPLIREFYNGRGIFSSTGSSMLPNSLTDLLQRHPRSVRNDDSEYATELDDIFSRHLKIKNRQYNEEYENEPKAYLSANFKSQTTNLLLMGKEQMAQLLRDAQSKIGEFLPKLQRGLPFEFATVAQLHDMHLKVPTTLGFPLTITLEAPMAMSIRGKLQANLESLRSKTVKIQTELKPSLVATFLCQVEAWSPITTSGVKVQAKVKMFSPIDAKVEVEWGSNPQIKAVIKPPTQKRDLVVLESRPLTYTRSWQQYMRSVIDESHTDEQTIYGEEVNRVNTFNKCYGKQTLGVDMCIRGNIQSSPKRSISGTPISLLTGQNKIVLMLQPSESNQDIQIKINTKVERLNGQEIHKPTFNILGRRTPIDDNDDSDSDSISDETTAEQSQETPSAERRQHEQRHPQSQSQSRTGAGSRPVRRNEDPFEKSRTYEVKQGYKTVLNVEFQGSSNGKVNMEVSHLFDARQRYGKLNMKMHRQHPDPFQVCFDGEMMFPERPDFVKDVKEKKVLAHAQLRWGQTCSGQNFVQLTTQAERSKQQVMWEKDQSEYKRYRKEEECNNNKGWCSPLTQEDFVEKIGHMLKYRVDIDYQNVPLSLRNVTNKLYRALKSYYYWQTDVDQINVQNPENKIRAEFVLDAETKQRVNVTVKTPKENIMIQDLPLARPLMVLNQKQPFSEQLVDYINNDEEDDDQNECSITGKPGLHRRSQVETFDGTKFSAPFTNCWVVLSKDCASEKPEFVVMARKSDKGTGDLKEVKIVTRQHRIELVPDNQEYDSIKVKVNGKTYDPENEEDITVHGRTIAKIDKEGQSINVELPETGVEVDFDGYAINVRLSDYYQGQQCGLCGHYDLESSDDFRNPDFTEEQDLRQYYMNYLIKDGRCQAPQLNEVCQNEDCDQDRSSSSSSSSSSDEDDNDNDETTEKPDHKTKVIEIDDQICFSTVPVPQCDDNSYSVQIKEQKEVKYTCIDQDSESAEEYERKARYGKKAVQGLTNRQPNFTRTESIPEKCKKYKS